MSTQPQPLTLGAATLHLGDCADILPTLPDASVDAIVTDPPYGLAFMGHAWDRGVPGPDLWRECLRVLKPGGHLLAFAGTRTQHRMASAIEDAGFEIRDMLAWVYGNGFPKSLDVSKAIDKAAGAEGGRGPMKRGGERLARLVNGARDGCGTWGNEVNRNPYTYAPTTESAAQWSGWGTALKPALEPITLARKPLAGTVAANVLEHGTGGLNIDGCRIDAPPWTHPGSNAVGGCFGDFANDTARRNDSGRWPANLIHDGSPEVVALFPDAPAAYPGRPDLAESYAGTPTGSGDMLTGITTAGTSRTDTGSAARFFYCPKADKSERDAGLDHLPPVRTGGMKGARDNSLKSGAGKERTTTRANHHPTVKPIDLMRYLVRLITPPGGTVLDPFMGSGSTGIAAHLEDRAFIGIEREPEYLEIATARISHAQMQQRLDLQPRRMEKESASTEQPAAPAPIRDLFAN